MGRNARSGVTFNPNNNFRFDLSEHNVEATFKICLATENSKEIKGCSLFQTAFGFQEDSEPIAFDKDLLEKYYKRIKFMFGQLASVHKGSLLITPETLPSDYTGTIWTDNNGIASMLLHLGVAVNIITPITEKTKTCTVLDAVPTLSPRDPNFPAWWEAHKAEWETAAE